MHEKFLSMFPRNVYFCIYSYIATSGCGVHLFSPGDLDILGGMVVTLESNGTSPQFTLACVSTGGPATTVTWTRDSYTINEGTETVLDDRVTAQYTHSLTVTETSSFNGTYSCSISNSKSSYYASKTIKATVDLET